MKSVIEAQMKCWNIGTGKTIPRTKWNCGGKLDKIAIISREKRHITDPSY